MNGFGVRNRRARCWKSTGLTKSFLGQRALDGVDFTLRSGEIHALLGENGAGKSTLIKAVTGVVQRDAGIVRLDGAEIMPRNAEEAVKAGIATVYQEVNLLPNLTVAENLYLGRQPTRFGLVRDGQMRRDAASLLRGFGLSIDVGVAARRLFGRGAAPRRDRARGRSVGAGADPRRADREPRCP